MLTFCVSFALVCAVEFAPERPGSIVVDLSEQMLYAYSEVGLVDVFPVATGGVGMETPVGVFAVQRLREKADLSNRFGYAADVPWIIEFARPYYIHTGPLTPSHGCVRMRLDDADWLWHWVQIGMSVTIQP